MGSHKVPDFIGIGANRSGSTWLHKMLSEHPQIWMPPIKELHYFDRNICNFYPGITSLLFGRDKRGVANRKRLMRRLRQALQEKKLSEISWLIKFYFGRRTDSWYQSLFPKKDGCIAGEITPAYSTLSKEDISHVYTLLPEIKILFTLRNPIDRAWSHIKYLIERKQKKEIGTIDIEAMMNIVQREGFSQRSNYIQTLDNWIAYYNQEQLHVGFYDDIVNNPSEYLESVCNFLGVKYQSSYFEEWCSYRVNATSNTSIPEELHKYLSQLYLEDLHALHERLGSYATTWLQEAESLLSVSKEKEVVLISAF